MAALKVNKPATLEVANRKAWRRWLEKNYNSASGVWLFIRKKNSFVEGIALDEAVEEALCFGWIDGRINMVDVNRFKVLITPRKPHSMWSRINKQRIEKLTQRGLMTPAGLQKVEAAKQDGSWNQLDAIDELRFPQDFEKALTANQSAQKNFETFSDAAKKQILWWIETAKRPETRQKRITQAVAMAAQNRKPV